MSLQGTPDIERRELSSISPPSATENRVSRLVAPGTFTFPSGIDSRERSGSSLSDRMLVGPTSPVKFSAHNPFTAGLRQANSRIPVRPGSSLLAESVLILETLATVVNPSVQMTQFMQLARQGQVTGVLSQLGLLTSEEKRAAIGYLGIQDKTGKTVLHHAIEAGDSSGALALIQFGIDIGGAVGWQNSGKTFINLPNHEQRTPLLSAAYMGLDSVVEALLQHGAHAWLEDCNKVTLLHILAMRHHVPLVRVLLAPPYSVASWRQDCFHYRADDYGKMDWESIGLLHPALKGERRHEEWPAFASFEQRRPPTPWNPCLHA